VRADAVVDLTVPPLRELARRRSEKWDVHPPDVLASTIAEMDFPLAPPIVRVLKDAISRHDVGYAYAATERLRNAFVGFARRRLSWDVDPDQVTLLPDVMIGIIEVARLLAKTGGTVAFAAPAYPPFFEELPHAGLRLDQVGLRLDGSIDLDDLQRALAHGAEVFLLANPHNPTGRALPLQELEEIAEICYEHGAWVIADEIHAPLVLGGAVHTAWFNVSERARERAVSLVSASKCFNIAGLKAALLVTASERARDMTKLLPPMGEHAGLLGVLAAEAAFGDGDDWLDAVITQLEANRDLLRAQLAAVLPEVRWVPPDATFLAWLDFRALGLGDDPAEIILRRGRLALSPGLQYGPRGAGFARLNFGTSPQLVEESVRRIVSACRGT
jgi:cysteine-S-conjugate beta-lyase